MKKIHLLTPGPTPVPERVLLAGAKPVLHHRTQEFSRLLEECAVGLKYLFQTKQDVYIMAASQARIDTSQYLAYGHSLFVDPWGTIQSEADVDEEVIYADFDKEVLDDTRQRLPLLKQRRPDLYSV